MNCPSGMNWLRHELNCVHELHLRCINDEHLAPGWHEVLVQSYNMSILI